MDSEGGYVDVLRRLDASKWTPTLFGAALAFVLLSFFTGWYSVDTRAEVYDYDAGAPEGKGDFLINAQVDVEMHALSLETKVRPDVFDRQIEEYGKPNYDDHAGRSGTVMLGVLVMSLTSLAALGVFLAFHAWNRKGRRDVGATARRAAAVFFALGLLTLLYFAVRIGPSAEQDTWVILTEYQPSRFVNDFPALHPDHLRPDIGFWNGWECCPPPGGVYSTNQGDKLVLVEVRSNPSAGFWMFSAAEAFAAVGFFLAARRGDFDAKPEVESGPSASTASSLPKAA